MDSIHSGNQARFKNKMTNKNLKSDDAAAATKEDPNADPEIQRQIMRALEGLGYGSVEIIVHDAKVVQIERKEKIRLNKNNPTKGK